MAESSFALKRSKSSFAIGLIAGALAFAAPATGQDPDSGPSNGDALLRVFLECSGGACDQREFRTEIDWVNWMRDRQDAHIHLIITRQETGSGGNQYELDFIGLAELEGLDDQLGYVTLGTDVRDEQVRGMTRVIAAGLARYSVLVGAGTPFDIVGNAGDPDLDRIVTSQEVDDPWDFWVFEVDMSTDFGGETSRKNKRFNGGVEARRVSETWKIEFDAGGSWRQNEIQLTDTTIVDTRRDWDTELFVAYALADHWSVGGRAEVSAATRTNQDLNVASGGAIEYSVWPYEESPRRRLRVRYSLGVRHFRYEEVTLFGQTAETRPVHDMEVSINQRQPWGSVFANINASQYMHDLSKNRLSTGGFLSFRIVRGLNLNVNGRVSWIRDQLFLPADDATDEEILLERRRLASSFDWDFGMGFSFQFGSIFNNVVNNRF